FTFAVLKGRANYLCLQKAIEIGEGDEQLVLDDVREDELGALGQELVRLLKWAKKSGTGDRAELDFEPKARAWAQLSVTARECPGAIKCPQGESCFAEDADTMEAAGRRLADALEAYRGRQVSAAELERPLNAAGEAVRAAQAAAREKENDENKRTRVLKTATTLIEDVAAVQSVGEGAV